MVLNHESQTSFIPVGGFVERGKTPSQERYVMTMTNDKLAATLAALERGEKPGCPFCGAQMIGRPAPELDSSIIAGWHCGMSTADIRMCGKKYQWMRHRDCYERELAQLREENAKLRVLNEELQAQWMKTPMCHFGQMERELVALRTKVARLESQLSEMRIERDEYRDRWSRSYGV
jgi:hypothetical protein